MQHTQVALVHRIVACDRVNSVGIGRSIVVFDRAGKQHEAIS